MATKDTEEYLPRCLDSILAQTYVHWELIAVNDHSTDRTREILDEYAARDPRIKVFDSDRPKLIPTLKFGYPHCTGQLINRMDSDDHMPADKLENLYTTWIKHGKGHVVAGGTQHFVDEGEVGDGFKRYDAWLNHVAANDLHYQEIYKECVIPSHCWLIHKEDLDRVGAFEPEVYPEDYDLTFRFYRHGLKIVGIAAILHYWRDRSDRISRTWEEYKDNRYFELKLRYFYELDRDRTRPLVVWGAGRNGKDLVRLIQQQDDTVHWVCDNENKIGKDIYGVRMAHYETAFDLDEPQIIVAVASPDGQEEIRALLEGRKLRPVKDFWFFC